MRLTLGILLVAGVGCFDSGGSSGGGGGSSNKDLGDNDPNRVVALGDSITEGICRPDGTPYPVRLRSISGKDVINQGLCDERSGGGASRINGVLSRFKPGYIVILYGANDAIAGFSTDVVLNNLRSMCNAAIANKTVPILGTCLPMYGGFSSVNSRLQSYNASIRALAKELGIRTVDFEKEFGSERSLIQGDGVHPSDAGLQVMAFAVNDRLPK
jgi:lysophospholipase L1-like esterase